MLGEKAARLQILSRWKEIANYLGIVRSVQRYERELGLPIHRVAGHSGGAVTAIKTELDVWFAAGPTRVDLTAEPLHERTDRVGVDFLQAICEAKSGKAWPPFEREATFTIQRWMWRVRQVDELMSHPISEQVRINHLHGKSIIERLRLQVCIFETISASHFEKALDALGQLRVHSSTFGHDVGQ